LGEYYIEVRGKKTFYKHWGDGPVMVLLHGIPTHSGLWDHMAEYLSKNYSVYAFDLLGYGESQRLESSEINIKSQARYFIEVFEELSLKNIVIVGHDIGGGIAQIMAVLNPQAFKAMVLIDSVCYDSWPIRLLRAENKLEMVFNNLPHDVLYELFTNYIRDGLHNKENAEKIAKKYWKYVGEQRNVKYFLEAVESLDNKYTLEISKMLDTIRMPVLILWGKYDAYIRMSFGYRLSEDIRNSVIEVIDDAGHFLPEDQPKKAADLIDNFLKSYGL